MNITTCTTLILVLFLTPLQGQLLDNRSFEGEPHDAVVPMGWHWCEEGTTPDICPGPWGVFTRPAEGSTYVGLITRPDGSFESIGQRFKRPLLKEACYQIELDLAHSPTYTGYNAITNCKIWLGTAKCDRALLVGEVKKIDHKQWETYKFQVLTDKAYEYIIIEATFPIPSFNSAGNVLIDNIRPIRPCDGV